MELIRLANDIRKEHGDLNPRQSRDILNIYWEHLVPPDEQATAFLGAVPPLDHLDTFGWLLQRAGSGEPEPNHAYIRSALLEAAGRRDEALAGYRALASRLIPDSGDLVDLTHKAIVRLTR
jgi:hypothetical protein